MTNIKKKILITIVIAVNVFAAILFVGCKKTFLTTPTLQYNSTENKVEWDAIENASKYQINVYKGQKADRQMLLFSAAQDKNYHVLSNYSQIVTVGVSCVGSEKFNSSSQKLITIDLDKKVIYQPGGSDSDKENITNEPIIMTKIFRSLSNIYYSKSELGKNTSVKVKLNSKLKFLSGFNLESSEWDFDDTTKILSIYGSYFARFEVGAKPEFCATLADGVETKFFVQVVNKLPYEIRDSNSDNKDKQYDILYTKTDSPLGMSIMLYDEDGKPCEKSPVIAVCIDGKEIIFDWISGVGAGAVNIRKDVLNAYNVGAHTLQVFTERGKSEVDLLIKSNVNLEPTNVWVDYESNYPYYSLKWSTPNIDKYAITDIIVTINGKKYALSDSFYAKYFSDNCLNLTSLLLPNSKLHIFVAVAVGSNIYTSAECVYDNNPDGSLVKYFTTTYDYFGKTINTYLRDDEEVTDLIYYAILHYDSLDVYDGDKLDEKGNIYQKMIKVYYAQGAEKLMPIIQNARASFPEAVSWYSSLQFKATSPSEITFCVTMRSTVTPTLVTSEPTCKSEQKNNDTHFGNGRRKIAYPTFDKVPFKIMQKYNFVLVQSTTELVMALERGLRPKFVVGSVVESVYNEAKKVLYEIVDDEMNDYAKVEAIYDWLSNNIMYDYKIATLSGELLPNDPRYIELYCNRAFFAEGVFFNKLAVCNGIAQAFVIMCRIEGIKAFKVTGSANGGSHAWNKVCIDGNWYVCDPTWANKSLDFDGDTITDSEVLSHNTLFMTNDRSGSDKQHFEAESQYKRYYAGDVNYNVFANHFYTVDGLYFGKKTDSDGNVLVGNEAATVANDLIFESGKQASIYIANKAAQRSGDKSFIVSFLVETFMLNPNANWTFTAPKGYTLTHYASRYASVIGNEILDGQLYQYGWTAGKCDYYLYIINVEKKIV